ncbi:MAG TPA: hypothetical protein VJ124_00350 [Pyrinomonadaceae bacterium]|nr:hypothetical protein [Pyrinomonadaceae bacterium]
MVKKILIPLALVIISFSCLSNKEIPSPRGGTIAGTLSGSNGPLQNAEVKLKSYKDENCAKLGQKNKLSQEEDQEFKQCSQQVSAATSDSQGKYAFPNIGDGWYGLEVNWTTNEDPLKNNPMWKPLFLYREEGFLITFIAASSLPSDIPFYPGGKVDSEMART